MQFVREGRFVDTELQSNDGKVIGTHRVILALVCDFFLGGSGFRETNRFQLDCNGKTLEFLVAFIYSNALGTFDVVPSPDLVPLLSYLGYHWQLLPLVAENEDRWPVSITPIMEGETFEERIKRQDEERKDQIDYHKANLYATALLATELDDDDRKLLLSSLIEDLDFFNYLDPSDEIPWLSWIDGDIRGFYDLRLSDEPQLKVPKLTPKVHLRLSAEVSHEDPEAEQFRFYVTHFANTKQNLLPIEQIMEMYDFLMEEMPKKYADYVFRDNSIIPIMPIIKPLIKVVPIEYIFRDRLLDYINQIDDDPAILEDYINILIQYAGHKDVDLRPYFWIFTKYFTALEATYEDDFDENNEVIEITWLPPVNIPGGMFPITRFGVFVKTEGGVDFVEFKSFSTDEPEVILRFIQNENGEVVDLIRM